MLSAFSKESGSNISEVYVFVFVIGLSIGIDIHKIPLGHHTKMMSKAASSIFRGGKFSPAKKCFMHTTSILGAQNPKVALVKYFEHVIIFSLNTDNFKFYQSTDQSYRIVRVCCSIVH